MQERILTPEQVAQILQVHPFTVLKFIKQGKLHASKLGRVYRIRESDLEGFLDQTSGRPVKSKQQESSESQLPKKIKNKNKTSPNSDSSNPPENNLEIPEDQPTTDQSAAVQEVKVDEIETQGNKPKHGGEDHYYILQ
jgi:excisionase family DNA binding protein